MAARVCGEEKVEWKRKAKTMSYFCNILENDVTYEAYTHLHKNKIVDRYGVDWAWDGITLPPMPLGSNVDDVLRGLNAKVRKVTGLANVTFVHKPFQADDILEEVIVSRRAMPAEVKEAAATVPQNEAQLKLEWKTQFEKKWFKVVNRSEFMSANLVNGVFDKFVVKNSGQMISSFQHECFDYNDMRGSSRRTSFIQVWLLDPSMRVYRDIGMYPPPLECPSDYFNMWVPFPHEANELSPEHPDWDEDAVQLFKQHTLEVICDGDESMFDYHVKRHAHMIQRPGEKAPCSVVTGEEGAGKTSEIRLCEGLVGKAKLLETSNPEQTVWGPFNNLMVSAYLVAMTETDKRNSAGFEGQRKQLVTDPTITINTKGKDQFVMNSFHRFMEITNSVDPTKTHAADRRNYIIRCSDKRIGDKEYFERFYGKFNTNRINVGFPSVYWYLKRIDLSDFDVWKLPRTAYHEMLIECNKSVFEQFMEHFVIRHSYKQTQQMFGICLVESATFYSSQIFDQYKEWLKTNIAGDFQIQSAIKLMKKIKTELKLPRDAILDPHRTSLGYQYTFNLVAMRKSLNITDIACIPLGYTLLADERVAKKARTESSV